METVQIALAADQNYFAGLLVTACSIAKYAAQDVCLAYTILDGGIGTGDYEELARRVRDYHANCSFRRIEVNDENFKECPIWNGNRMTYARLMLPYLLEDVEYCIYCDVDFLWMRDIGELWAERDPAIALISTKDGNLGTLKTDGEWLLAHGLPFDPETYFCAGLTFFNLKMFRDEGLAARCFELLKQKPPYNDQTVLYVATFGRTKLVEKKRWQVFTYELSQSVVDDGCVIHYAGEIPWKRYPLWFFVMSDAAMIWHRFHALVRGMTVRASILRFLTPRDVFYHRGLYWLLRTPVLRQLFLAPFRVMRKRQSVDYFESASRSIRER